MSIESNVKAMAGVDISDNKLLHEITRLETMIEFYLYTTNRPLNALMIRQALKKQVAVIKTLANE